MGCGMSAGPSEEGRQQDAYLQPLHGDAGLDQIRRQLDRFRERVSEGAQITQRDFGVLRAYADRLAAIGAALRSDGHPAWKPECALDHVKAAGQIRRVLAGDTRWASGDRDILAGVADTLDLTSEEAHSRERGGR